MPLLEDRSAAFIVRVWCERGDDPTGDVKAWRGSIEHVPSGQRVYFQELEVVLAFMKPYLVELGIEAPNRFWERMEDIEAMRSDLAPSRRSATQPSLPGAPPPSATKR